MRLGDISLLASITRKTESGIQAARIVGTATVGGNMRTSGGVAISANPNPVNDEKKAATERMRFKVNMTAKSICAVSGHDAVASARYL